MTGTEFRKHRQRLRMTQVQLAGQLGVHPITLSRWERDHVRIPGPVVRLLALLSPHNPKGRRRRPSS